MGRNNNVPAAIDAVAIVESVEPVKEAPLLTIVPSEPEEAPRKLSLEEKIQRVEDLTLLIDRFRNLVEAKRKLTVFQLGADGMSSSIILKDAAGNEFKTSNSSVISSVIDEMKRILDLKVRDIEDLINF
jgi:single-stranded DNA-specific DHH superfamily exonuclease